MNSFRQGPMGAWGPDSEAKITIRRTETGEVVEAELSKWISAMLLTTPEKQLLQCLAMVQGKPFTATTSQPNFAATVTKPNMPAATKPVPFYSGEGCPCGKDHGASPPAQPEEESVGNGQA